MGVLCVAGLAASGMLNANASSESLPHTTPAKLLAAMRSVEVTGFSGTVLSQLSLGLPELPSIGGNSDETTFTSLLSGSHTLQVWYGGAAKQRIALLGSTDETDVFRDGRDLWQWSSANHLAVHVRLPAEAAGAGAPEPSSANSSLTPLQMAQRLISNIDPSTKVSVDDDRTVADRATYELVLTPRTPATKIGSVHIAVDGATKVPLGVQVYARGANSPAVDVEFTSIRFGAQPDRNFQFKPPPDATVHQSPLAEHASGPMPAAKPSAAAGGATAPPHVTGSGWSSVVAIQVGKSALAKLQHGPFGRALTPVSGTWGSGRLLDSALLSVLVTDDGRLFAGAVEPSGLYAAAGAR